MSKDKKKKLTKKAAQPKSKAIVKKRAAGGGRKTALDLKDRAILAQVELFGSLGSPQQEMADYFGVCRQTIGAYMADEEGLFFNVYKKAESKLKNNLRRSQINKALKGDNTMLVWLGKNLLDQEDKARVINEDAASITEEELAEMTPAQAYQVYKSTL